MCIVSSEKCSSCESHTIHIARCLNMLKSIDKEPCLENSRHYSTNEDFLCDQCIIEIKTTHETIKELKERLECRYMIKVEALTM